MIRWAVAAWVLAVLLAQPLGQGCTLGPMRPPVEPPAPSADGTPCEQACGRRAQLGCPGAFDACVATCGAYEQTAAEEQSPELAWQPSCMALAKSCAAWDACRGTR